MKRHGLAALCGLAVILFCTGAAWGAQPGDGESGKYIFSGGTIEGIQKTFIEGIEPEDDGYRYVDLDIPAEIDGRPVTAIGDSAFYPASYSAYPELRVRSISLARASSLQTIGKYAFYNMGGSLYGAMEPSLLKLPEGLRSIGGNAFCYQRGIGGDLFIPDSVESIEASAFMGAGFDGTLRLPENPAFVRLESQTFKDCRFSGVLTIPDNVTAIAGGSVFTGARFSRLILHDGIEEIGKSSFRDCAALTEIQTAGGNAGSENAAAAAALPSGLKVLGDNAFNGCAGLEGSVVLPEGLVSAGISVFGGTGIQTIYASHSMTTVYHADFIKNMGKLTAFVFQDKEGYDKYRSAIGSSQQKFCAYPAKVVFQDQEGGVLETRDVLYNRPLNFAADAGLVWQEDPDFTLPALPGAAKGYQLKWTADRSELTGVPVSAVVRWDTLFPVLSLEDPVITFGAGIDKAYDGTPSLLHVTASHPLASLFSEADVGNVLFYYWWYWDTITPTEYVLKGFDQDAYDVGGVRAPFAISCSVIVQAYIVTPERETQLFYTAPSHSFVVDMRKGEPVVNPVYPAGTLLLSAGLPDLSIKEGDTPGKISWDDGQSLAEGEHAYSWTFLPEDSKNYNTASGSIVLKAAASLPDPGTGSGSGHSGGSHAGSGTGGSGGNGYDIRKTVTQTDGQAAESQVTGQIKAGAAEVTAQRIEDALKAVSQEAEALAKETGTQAQTKVEIISETGPAEVPAQALHAVKDAGALLALQAEQVKVTFGSEALAVLAQAGDEKLLFSAQLLARTGEQADGAAVCTLDLHTERGTVSDLNGDVTVEVPYEKSAPHREVIVYYVAEDGSRTRVTEVTYDAAEKKAVFHTTHFSVYEIRDIAPVPFGDVKGHWAEEAVSFAVEHGLFEGTSRDTFSPETVMTRAMLVTVLCHAAGDPDAAGEVKFTDVAEDAWYRTAVNWAAQAGIAQGYPDGQQSETRAFKPDQPVTREELAVMLCAADQIKSSGETMVKSAEGEFSDWSDSSEWARKALSWAVDQGILSGKGGKILDPKGPATRAETAAILKNDLTRLTR